MSSSTSGMPPLRRWRSSSLRRERSIWPGEKGLTRMHRARRRHGRETRGLWQGRPDPRRATRAKLWVYAGSAAGASTVCTVRRWVRPSRAVQLIDCPDDKPISATPMGVEIEILPSAMSASPGNTSVTCRSSPRSLVNRRDEPMRTTFAGSRPSSTTLRDPVRQSVPRPPSDFARQGSRPAATAARCRSVLW